MALRTRKPTGTASWPLILLAGEAKTGKTWQAAEFSGDERISRTFWLDLAEGCADEYGAVPGADYEIVEHNGTWVDILEQVSEVRDVARQALVKGENPVMLVIDSMTAEWAMLSAWADSRARRSTSNKQALAANPDAEIDITANYWNDAKSRHNRLMNILKTFPGIVVMTALETEKTQFGPNGKPIKNAPPVARPDAQKRLTADATVWVRLSLDDDPTIVGLRSVKYSIRPGKDKPKPWADFTLAKLVFDFLGVSAKTAQARDMPVLDADQLAPDEVVSDEEPAAPQAKREARQGPRAVAPASRRDVDALAAAFVDEWLVLGDGAGVAGLWKRMVAEANVAADVDVSGLLTADDREMLGIQEMFDIQDDEPVTLQQFATSAAKYVKKFGRAVRAPLGESTAA